MGSSNSNNKKILLSDQSTRQYTDVRPSVSNFNLSESTNSVSSNTIFTKKSSNLSPLNNYLFSKTNYPDLTLNVQLLSNHSFLPDNHPSIASNTTLLGKIDYANM